MTRRGRSTYISSKLNFKRCFALLSFSFLCSACANQAPEDYYFKFALMKEWGQYNRQQTGRALDEVISHPEDTEPLILAFEVGDSPATLLGFVPLENPEPESTRETLTAGLPKVRISLQRDVVDGLFKEREIQVSYWQLKDGRLEGEQNVVLAHFIPRAFSDRAIKTEFLMIFAIMHGAQVQEEKNTIDILRGIAQGEDGTPIMTLEAQTSNYKAYLQGQINIQEWENQLKIRRF